MKASNKYIFLIACAMLLGWHYGSAQGRLSVEFRPSANFVTNDQSNVTIKNGGGFEGVFAYRFLSDVSVYFGWQRNSFASKESFAGSNVVFIENGYTYGLQFIHPVNPKLAIYLRGGGVTDQIEVENGTGQVSNHSPHGFGWQAEGGCAIVVGKSWSLLPGIRYHSLSRDILVGTFSYPLNLKYISLGMGVQWRFGSTH